jgi:hypothetical protein
MKHFVITRIGLGIYREPRLNKIIDLAEAVTFSSLANQTNQEFVCLVVLDAHMPRAARNKIDQLLDRYSNFCAVPIDVTSLIEVHVGSFDWVWDQCQDFILGAGFIEDPRDYIITSVLDADDAWHRDVVSSVNSFFAQRLSKLRAMEKDRTTWVRHSGGMTMTFPRGYQWYIAPNKVDVLTMEFHSMAVFVTSRFSSGISACSSRHSQWREYSKVVQFDVALEAIDRPMWIYTRHHDAVVAWNALQAMQVDSRLENELSDTFGVDMEKIRRWRAAYPAGANSMYSGQRTTGEQYDRIFHIASVNRKIRALNTQIVAGDVDPTNLKEELKRCQAERARLVAKLQS